MSQKTLIITILLLVCASVAGAEREYYVRIDVSLRVEQKSVESTQAWIRQTHRQLVRTIPISLNSLGTSKRKYPNGLKSLGCAFTSSSRVAISKVLEFYAAIRNIQDQPGVMQVRRMDLRLSATHPMN